MSELKRCPFCGGDAKINQSEPSTARFNEGAVHFAASCSNFKCEVMPKANIWQMSPEDAAKAWNTRAIELIT